MMNDITAREQRYRRWRQNWQSGQVNEETFLAAVDELGFQDECGYTWMIGAKTGLWYYHDGRQWQQADPRQADRLCAPPATTVAAPRQAAPAADEAEMVTSVTTTPLSVGTLSMTSLLAVPVKSVLIVSLAFFVVLALVWPVGGAPSFSGAAAAPSPRPPLGGDGGGGGGGGGGSGQDGNGGGGNGAGFEAVQESSIRGTLIDLSTDQPGAGIEIAVNGSIVRTDTDGSYSITGLSAGSYTVTPVLLGRGTPGDPVFVTVDGQNSVTVDLGYYSQAPPLPTDTPQPVSGAVVAAAVQATPPPALPDSGAPVAPRPFIFVGLGLLLALSGGLLLSLSRPAGTDAK
jgi:hypothetical protein